MSHNLTTRHPARVSSTSNATSSLSLLKGDGNYVPSRKTLGLELVASEKLLAKHSDWSFGHSKESCISTATTSTRKDSAGKQLRGAQRRKQANSKSKSMTAVATKMTTTIRSLLTPPHLSTSKTELSINGFSKDYIDIDLAVPDKEVSTPKTITAMPICRLEANARDTPSIFASVRKSRRKPAQKRQNDVKFDVNFDVNAEEIKEKNVGDVALPPPANAKQFGAFDEFFVDGSNTSVVDFMFGKQDSNTEHIEVADGDNSFVLGQTFDSAFNFVVVGASASKSFTRHTIAEDHIKDIDREQIEVTDDANFYGEGRTVDDGSNIDGDGAAAAAPVAGTVHSSEDDLTEVDTTILVEPSNSSLLLTKDEPSAARLPCDDVKARLVLPTIVHDSRTQSSSSLVNRENDKSSSLIESQQQKQVKLSSSNCSVAVPSGAALATINVRDFFCTPKVSSSDIHQLLRIDSFMEYSKDSPVLESLDSLSMKREFSNESPTGVEQLTLYEYQKGSVSDSNIVCEGKDDDDDDDDDDATWNSLDTQKTVNTCNTSKISRRRSSSITSQKTRQVHFVNCDQEDIRDNARVCELNRVRSGCSSSCGKDKEVVDPQDSEQTEKTENTKSLTNCNDLTTDITPASPNFVHGITKLFGKCFVNNEIGSSTKMIRSPVKAPPQDYNAAMIDQPLTCIHPPKIHRSLKPIDLFHAKDHNDSDGLRGVFHTESVDANDKSRFEDLKNQVDDDTLETSTVDSTVCTLNSKESTESSTVQTDEASRRNPISSWVENGFFDVIDKVDNVLNGCTKNVDDDCSDAPYDEEDPDDKEEDSDDEEELSIRGSWEMRNGRCSLHRQSHSRHLRHQARIRNTVSDTNGNATRPDGEYRVRFVSPARNEPDGTIGSGGCNVILPSMSDSLILGEHCQLLDSSPKEQITQSFSVDGGFDAQRAHIAQSKFALYRSYAQSKRRFGIKKKT